MTILKPKKPRIIPWCAACAHFHTAKVACAPVCPSCAQHHAAAGSCEAAGPDADRWDRMWDRAVARQRAENAARENEPNRWHLIEEMHEAFATMNAMIRKAHERTYGSER